LVVVWAEDIGRRGGKLLRKGRPFDSQKLWGKENVSKEVREGKKKSRF